MRNYNNIIILLIPFPVIFDQSAERKSKIGNVFCHLSLVTVSKFGGSVAKFRASAEKFGGSVEKFGATKFLKSTAKFQKSIPFQG